MASRCSRRLESRPGDATGIAEVAEAFIAAFPDIEVFMDDLVLRAEYDRQLQHGITTAI